MKSTVTSSLSWAQCISFTGAVGVFLISLLFSAYYVEGDQVTYRHVYATLEDMPFIEAAIFYSNYLNFTVELGHFFIIWLGSNFGISKDFLMALINGVLAYSATSVLNRMQVHPLVSLSLVVFNYYFYGLYFAAERLKFGFLFFFIALLIRADSILKISVIIASIFSHVQMIIVYSCIVLANKIQPAMVNIFRLRFAKKIFLTGIVLWVLYAQLGDYVLLKIGNYFEYETGQNFAAFFRITIFMILSCVYSKDKRKTIAAFILLYPVTFIVGPERVNMLGYIFFLYDALRYKAGINLPVIITSIYFGLKGISFIAQFIEVGHGFGEFTTFPGNVLF